MFRIKNNTSRNNLGRPVSINWGQYDRLIDYISYLGLFTILSTLILSFAFIGYTPEFVLRDTKVKDDLILDVSELGYKQHLVSTLSLLLNKTIDEGNLLKILEKILKIYLNNNDIEKIVKEINNKTIDQTILNDNLILIVEELQDLNCAVHKCKDFGDPNMPGTGSGLIDFIEEHNISNYVGEFIYNTRLANSKCLLPFKNVILGDVVNNGFISVSQNHYITGCSTRGCASTGAYPFGEEEIKCFPDDKYSLVIPYAAVNEITTIRLLGYYPRELQILEDYMLETNWFPDILVPVFDDLKIYKSYKSHMKFKFIDLTATPPMLMNYDDGELTELKSLIGYETVIQNSHHHHNLLFLPIEIRRKGEMEILTCSAYWHEEGTNYLYSSFNVDKVFSDFFQIFGFRNTALNSTIKLRRQDLTQSLVTSKTYGFTADTNYYAPSYFEGLNTYTYSNATFDYDPSLLVNANNYPTICRE